MNPQDAYARATLRGAPPDARPGVERRWHALALAARVLAATAILTTILGVLAGLWALANAAGLAPASWQAGKFSSSLGAAPGLAEAPLAAAAGHIAWIVFCAMVARTLWLAGGWARLRGERPLPRAAAAERLARVGRGTTQAALALLAAGAFTWLWELGAGRTISVDVVLLATSGLGLLGGARMRVAAQALEGDRKAN